MINFIKIQTEEIVVLIFLQLFYNNFGGQSTEKFFTQ